jgi:2-polyprenyl-3-methyl-5-hydroxy-6-metoxy-1,4-benzoquinol methylase
VITMAEKVMRRFYRQARGVPERLPWHREEPSPVLVSAVKARDRHGRALDVGCGAGVFSVWPGK